MRKKIRLIVTFVIAAVIVITGLLQEFNLLPELTANTNTADSSFDITDYSNTSVTVHDIQIPQYDGTSAAYVLNDNEPFFVSSDLSSTAAAVEFSSLDDYGRAGVANAVLGKEIMQTHERGSISSIHPSGWWEAKQSDVNVNRSHLIGNNLAGDQTDVSENMITGSRQLNAGGKVKGSMLDYENDVADYMEDTGNHVRYRVTPVFENNDTTAHGVLMEAESIEDNGSGIKFCVYIYNIQPDYVCDYQTGEWSKITQPELTTTEEAEQ